MGQERRPEALDRFRAQDLHAERPVDAKAPGLDHGVDLDTVGPPGQRGVQRPQALAGRSAHDAVRRYRSELPQVVEHHRRGRKSGQPRATGLFYIVDGPNLVVVASNAGATTDPAWAMNLRAEPAAEVEIGGKRRPVHGREASAEEVSRLWPRLVAANPNYDDYKARSEPANGWGGQKVAYLDEIRWIPTPDVATRVATLE